MPGEIGVALSCAAGLLALLLTLASVAVVLRAWLKRNGAPGLEQAAGQPFAEPF